MAYDAAAERRWITWKQDGARLDLRRKERFRTIFAALCFGGVFWMLWYV